MEISARCAAGAARALALRAAARALGRGRARPRGNANGLASLAKGLAEHGARLYRGVAGDGVVRATGRVRHMAGCWEGGTPTRAAPGAARVWRGRARDAGWRGAAAPVSRTARAASSTANTVHRSTRRSVRGSSGGMAGVRRMRYGDERGVGAGVSRNTGVAASPSVRSVCVRHRSRDTPSGCRSSLSAAGARHEEAAARPAAVCTVKIVFR